MIAKERMGANVGYKNASESLQRTDCDDSDTQHPTQESREIGVRSGSELANASDVRRAFRWAHRNEGWDYDD